MKKLIALFVVLVVAVGAFCLLNVKDEDYLRIHIRANSNSELDQQVKYAVKDTLVEALKPIVESIESKEQMMEVLNDNLPYMTNVVNDKLNQLNQNYGAKISICEEKFPTRSYEELTLGAGVYDAIIVELGSAKGDNWWCVAYPPLCFVTADNESDKIEYKSIFGELIKKYS